MAYRQNDRIGEPAPGARGPEPASGPDPRHIPDAIRFLTRVPVPEKHRSGAQLADIAWAFPLVGLLVGLVGGLVLLVTTAIGVPPPVAATAAVAAAALLTGALHEDGLADTFDGFGGSTREQRLAIMRTSDIGAFGIAALVLVLAARIGAVAVLASRDAVAAMFALAAAESVSRAVMVGVWRALPPARADGLAAEGGRPGSVAVAYGSGIALLAMLLAAAFGPPPASAVFATVFAAIGAYILALAVLRSIGGRTGDTLGAEQQLTLALLLAGFCVA